jgi:hypothetical protein
MVIRAAFATRSGHPVRRTERVPNAALVPLDPVEAEHADPGGGAATPSS